MHGRTAKLLTVVTLFSLGAVTGLTAQYAFLRGDVNADGIVSIMDAQCIGNFLFRGELDWDDLPCRAAVDTNADDCLDIADEIVILQDLGPEPGRISSSPHFPLDDVLATCEETLTNSPAVDSGAALVLDEVVAQGEEILVPLRVAGVEGSLTGWQVTLTYPVDVLEYVRTDFPREDQGQGFHFGELLEPGTLKLAEMYSVLALPEDEFPVTEGTALAGIVFRPIGQPSGSAALNLVDTYGTAELTFHPENPTIFPAVAGGGVIVDADPVQAPAGLQAAVSGGTVQLSWSNEGSYDGVVVERNGAVIATLAGSATSYEDSPPSGEHGYRVRGKNGTELSPAPFAYAAVWTLAAPQVTNVLLPSPGALELRWLNGAAYDTIRILRNGEVLADITGDATTYTDPTLGALPAASAVYHVQGIAGGGHTRRVAAIHGQAHLPNFGEHAVENLTCAFTEPAQLVIRWDPAPAAESYKVVERGILLAVLDGTEDQFVHNPPPSRRSLRYEINTIIGGDSVARSTCVIPYENDKGVRNLGAVISEVDTIATLTWKNSATYAGIAISQDGELIASLPGDATRFTHQVNFDGATLYVTFTVQAVGSGFTTPPTEVTVGDPSLLGEFLRGDANWDGTVSIADALYIRRFLFGGHEPPVCMDAADANDDGCLDIADQVCIVHHTLLEDIIFPEPYPLPGFDLTPDGLSCQDDEEVVSGEFTEDILDVGEVEAAPGEEVWVPIYLTNLVPVEAVQLVIKYPTDTFTVAEGGTNGAMDFSGTAYEVLSGDVDPHYESVHAPEGTDYFLVGAMWSFTVDMPIPPGDDQLLVRIKGTVSEDATPGEIIDLEPTNGPNNEGVGMHRLRNEITSRGESRYVAFYPKTLKGFIEVKDNPTTLDFLRGDANANNNMDIADPIFILMFLFADGPAPPCPDAADVDDSGDFDLADPIMALNYLFVTGGLTPEMPPTINTCAQDKTPDELGPCHYTGCR